MNNSKMPLLTQNSLLFDQQNVNFEKEIMLCCSQLLLDISHRQRLRSQLNYDINWDYLIGLANQQGITSLLYWNLNQICPELIPTNILEQLKERFYINISRNLTLTNELLNLLAFFATYNIPAIPFKGAVLSASIYGHIGLRQFGDLDILVHKKDFLKAIQLLENQGYTPRRKRQKNHYKARFYVDFQNELEFVHPEQKIVVDLHCHISPLRFSGYPPIKHLWNSTEEFSLLGQSVLKLKVEEQLILLCLHGSKENWEKFSRICDIGALLQSQQEINWSEVMRNSQKWGSQRLVYIGLFLVNRLLDIEIPDIVWKAMQKDLVAQNITDKICEQFFFNDYTEAKSPQRFLFHLNSRNTIKGKLTYCLLSSLYYPLRSCLGVKH